MLGAMGMFDTVYFDKPFTCRSCGAEIDQVQTKVFEPGLRDYRTGDVVAGSPVLNGVLREDLYCAACNTAVQPVYFAVWHTLLVGTWESPEEAERRVDSVDRAQLLDWLADHQQRALRWHDRFSRLYGELQNLHDYQRDESAASLAGNELPVTSKFFRIRQYITAPDPLGDLIEANRPSNPEDETEVGRAVDGS